MLFQQHFGHATARAAGTTQHHRRRLRYFAEPAARQQGQHRALRAQTQAVAGSGPVAPGGALVTSLTILLTLVIAWFAINLMLGRASLSVRSVTPRMMTIGLVLTFVTSWVAYSTMVWNLAIGGPDWIAGVITGSRESATQVFAQKIDVVFQALQQASPQDAAGEDLVLGAKPMQLAKLARLQLGQRRQRRLDLRHGRGGRLALFRGNDQRDAID